MLASAKDMSEGGTATIYMATTVPGLLVKLSSPYWFDRVGYRRRLAVAALCMALAFVVTSRTAIQELDRNNNTDAMEDTTSQNSTSNRLLIQMCGVAVVSVQIGLGEASLLALAGKLDRIAAISMPLCCYDAVLHIRNDNNDDYTTNLNNSNPHSHRLLAFASGTGLAGFMAYLWKVSLTEWVGWSMSRMLLTGILLAMTYWMVLVQVLRGGTLDDDNNGRSGTTFSPRDRHRHQLVPHCDEGEETSMNQSEHEMVLFASKRNKHMIGMHDPADDGEERKVETTETTRLAGHEIGSKASNGVLDTVNEMTLTTNHPNLLSELTPIASLPAAGSTSLLNLSRTVLPISSMSWRERWHWVLSLWPYTIPLFTVYAAEYACQAGAWTAIGFPTVHTAQARAQFYTQSNWLYQAASFVARSSGVCWTLPLWGLWLLPVVQLGNLLFFAITATTHGMFYHRGLLLTVSVYTGLLGGSVYVQGYKRIVKDLPPAHTEFALSTVCVAEALGVLVADVVGLFLQSCLYQWNGVQGALVHCPV